MAEAIAEATAKSATTVVGGGDTATAAGQFKVDTKVSRCSTWRLRQPSSNWKEKVLSGLQRRGNALNHLFKVPGSKFRRLI